MIERIEYENYLVLKDVAIDFERFTMLVGPNACGKSTVLDSIPTFLDLRVRPPIPLLRSSKADRGYQIRLLAAAGQAAAFESSQGWVNEHRAEDIPSLLRSVEVLRLVPHILRAPARHFNAGQQIGPDGSGLGAVLADISLDDSTRRDHIGELLSRVVPTSCGISVRRSTGSNDTYYEPVVEFDNIGKVFVDRLSEGTLYALAIITALSTENRPKLLLIDDLDKGLHPSAQAELIAILRSFLADDPELQIIATTHSPYLLDHFEPREVRVMTLGDDGFAKCRSLADHPNIEKWKGALVAGEMWSSVGESWIREPEVAGTDES